MPVLSNKNDCFDGWNLIDEEYTIFTLSIGTDMPEKTVDWDQMLQNAVCDQGLNYLPLI